MTVKARVEKVSKMLLPIEVAREFAGVVMKSGNMTSWAIEKFPFPDFVEMAKAHVPGLGPEVAAARGRWAEAAWIEYETYRGALRLAWTYDYHELGCRSGDRDGVKAAVLLAMGMAWHTTPSTRQIEIAGHLLRISKHSAMYSAHSRREGVASAREWYRAIIEADPAYAVAPGGKWEILESERARIMFEVYGPTPPDIRKNEITYTWER